MNYTQAQHDSEAEDEALARPYYKGELALWLSEHPGRTEVFFMEHVWPTIRRRIATFELERERQSQRNH